MPVPPKILSAYVTCSLKIFGTWAARLAASDSDWSSSTHNEDAVLKTVKETKEWLQARSLLSEDVEAMEKIAEMKQLLAFVEADVEGQKKRKQTSSTVIEEPGKGVESTKTKGPAEPNYPKSLFLVRPLLARPLHPLPLNVVPSVPSSSAFGGVAIPEGLDLDTWIVPLSKLKRLYPDADDAADASPDPRADESSLVVKKKKTKGKEKAADQDGTSDIKRKSKKKKAEGQESHLAASASVGAVEDTAERAAQERVGDTIWSLID